MASRRTRTWLRSQTGTYTTCATAAATAAQHEYEETHPTQVSIGERRKPKPDGKPGYVRVDMVHQGDQDGIKGIYHLNTVDEVTQWQVVGASPHICEAWLQPVLEAAWRSFRSQSEDSIPTTAVSSSTTKWRRCYKTPHRTDQV